MHKAYEFEDSCYLRSGKRYKVDSGDCFEHHHSSSSKEKPNSPPMPQRILINPTVSIQTPPRGQGTPL